MHEHFGCRTTDPGRAKDWLAERYTDHKLHCCNGSASFDFGHMATGMRFGSANFLQYGTEVEIRSGSFPDFYMLEMPLSGGVHLSIDGVGDWSSSRNHALFIAPGRPLTSVWRPNTRQFMLKLDAHEIQTRWQQLTNDPAAVLPATPPLIEFSTDEGWRVQQLLKLFKAEFERGHQAGSLSLHASPLPGAVIDSVLAYLQKHHRDTLDPQRNRPLPATMRKCCQYIDTHLSQDISLTDLETVAGISRRSLFNQFATFLDTTPIKYLELQRLKAVRRLLLARAMSVSEAAEAVGFRHMGRFSGRYAAVYSEKPSDTRRRGSVRYTQPLSG